MISLHETETEVPDVDVALTYRLLDFEEWDRLVEPCQAAFGPNALPPSPAVSSCAVAEDASGEIVGFLFLQFVPHMEPFGGIPGLGVSLSELVSVFDSRLPQGLEYYVMVQDAPRPLAKAAELGLEPVVGVQLHKKRL